MCFSTNSRDGTNSRGLQQVFVCSRCWLESRMWFHFQCRYVFPVMFQTRVWRQHAKCVFQTRVWRVVGRMVKSSATQLLPVNNRRVVCVCRHPFQAVCFCIGDEGLFSVFIVAPMGSSDSPRVHQDLRGAQQNVASVCRIVS